MKKKMSKSKFLLFLALLILIFVGVVFAIDTTSTGFRLNKNTIMQVVSPSYCYQATNTGSANDYFVPTKTNAELLSFVNNKPGDVTSATCSSLPPRVAEWSGKVNQHTDSNGVWQTDPDCTTGAGQNLLTYCRKFNSETISYSAYAIETITKWTERGCTGLYTSAKQSYKCILCSEYSSQSTCDSAGCSWHYYGYACSRFACASYGSGDCVNMGCYWGGSTCLNVPYCGWYYDETECNYDFDCNWDSYNYCCYNPYEYYYPCSELYSQYDCELEYDCQWDSGNSDCHEQCA